MVHDSAQALFWAWQMRRAVPALPKGLDATTGRAVQERLHELFLAAGREPAGWKIGLTAPAAMALFGANEPMVGLLYRDSLRGDGARLDPAELISPRIEGEMLIEIGEVPAADASDDTLRGSIASVRPAFEIADSHVVGWADTIGAAIADNACCGLLVMPDRGVPADDVDFRDSAMELSSGDGPVTRGRASDCLGGILNVYRWFLADSARHSRILKPGDIMLCGAMGKPAAMAWGQTYSMTLTDVGILHCSTGAQDYA